MKRTISRQFLALFGLALLLSGCTPPAAPPKPTPITPPTPPAPTPSAHAILTPTTAPSTRPAVASTQPARPRFFHISSLIDKPDTWYSTPEARTVADNIVGWQNANGGWFKNYDPHKPRPAVVPDIPNKGPPEDSDKIWHQVSTIDNDATASELRILGHAYRILRNPAYKQSFDRGLAYVLQMQYPNGGWPQRYPLQNNYGRYITINDDAMLNVVSLLKDIADRKPDFELASDDQVRLARAAFDRGLNCLYACQVRIDGKPTIWCQQYDEITLAPRGGRTFELPGLSGRESVDLVLFLMKLENPDKRLRTSINSAMTWFEAHKLTGKTFKEIPAPNTPKGTDRVLVDDPKGKPLWARFYDLKTEQPFFCGRDGIPHPSVDQISYERRNGYEWWGPWGLDARKEYKLWKARLHDMALTTAAPAK